MSSGTLFSHYYFFYYLSYNIILINWRTKFRTIFDGADVIYILILPPNKSSQYISHFTIYWLHYNCCIYFSSLFDPISIKLFFRHGTVLRKISVGEFYYFIFTFAFVYNQVPFLSLYRQYLFYLHINKA